MSGERSVLYVSKPVVPPWNDGSKNLVRDVSGALVRHRATVLVTKGTGPPPEGNVSAWPVYRSRGRFSPAIAENARVVAALARARGHAVWHFVFGDVVVALSEWTRERLVAAGADRARVVVIPPCARPLEAPSDEARARLRRELALGAGPLVVYPGDLEVSTGAETVARAVDAIVRHVPEARVVFACRRKTPRAAPREAELAGELRERGLEAHVRFVGELPDLATLIHEASVVVMPCDDLYGKVDVPLVVVEALAAGIPLVLARGGPLESVTAARFVDARDSAGLAREVVQLVCDAAARAELTAAGRALYAAELAPSAVAARYEALYER